MWWWFLVLFQPHTSILQPLPEPPPGVEGEDTAGVTPGQGIQMEPRVSSSSWTPSSPPVTLVWSSAQPRNHLLLPVFPGCLLHTLIHS